MKLGLGNTLTKTKASKSAAVNPFAASPRTFLESPQQVIFNDGATLLLYASNGAGGAIKMNASETSAYPNSTTAFLYYSWNGAAWVYVGVKTQGTNFNVSSFSHSTFNIINWNNAVFFAANYTP